MTPRPPIKNDREGTFLSKAGYVCVLGGVSCHLQGVLSADGGHFMEAAGYLPAAGSGGLRLS